MCVTGRGIGFEGYACQLLQQGEERPVGQVEADRVDRTETVERRQSGEEADRGVVDADMDEVEMLEFVEPMTRRQEAIESRTIETIPVLPCVKLDEPAHLANRIDLIVGQSEDVLEFGDAVRYERCQIESLEACSGQCHVYDVEWGVTRHARRQSGRVRIGRDADSHGGDEHPCERMVGCALHRLAAVRQIDQRGHVEALHDELQLDRGQRPE